MLIITSSEIMLRNKYFRCLDRFSRSRGHMVFIVVHLNPCFLIMFFCVCLVCFLAFNNSRFADLDRHTKKLPFDALSARYRLRVTSPVKQQRTAEDRVSDAAAQTRIRYDVTALHVVSGKVPRRTWSCSHSGIQKHARVQWNFILGLEKYNN